jgi:uroporphyrinogen decarboxylase
METSRERFIMTVNHIEPEVVPLYLMGFDEMAKWLKRCDAQDNLDLQTKLGLDVLDVRAVYTGPHAGLGRDIWGKDFSELGSTGFGYSSSRGAYPLAEATSVADVDNFPWPDSDHFDYQVVRDVLETMPADRAKLGKIVYATQAPGQTRVAAARGLGKWIPLFCGLADLFGMENTLMNLHGAAPVMEATIAHLEHLILGFARRLLDSTDGMIDALFFGDDFSTQSGLMISPADWRRFLKPTYGRLFALVKSYGVKVWFHSCGTFRPVLPDLIDMGMDIWETVQVHLPGNAPEVLKRDFGQHLTFSGAISTQKTLPFGTPEDVSAEVRERIRVLGRGGGYICGGDHFILPDVPDQNVMAMLDEARNFRL